AAEIADLLRYTGFVAPGRQLAKPPGGAGEGEIVVSVGGGAVGFELLRTAIDAARLLGEAGPPWRLLVGPDIAPDGMAALAAHAGGVSRVTVERARPDFPALLDRAALSVSQAGYNTVMDLLAAGCRAILVPFARGGESEQSDRATLLAARGLATVLPETGLAADRLAHAVTEALDRPRPGPVAGLALDGARESARILIAEAARRDR
ncbi:MAG: glycosyltransferase, partial [Azospirillaceae bacterium]